MGSNPEHELHIPILPQKVNFSMKWSIDTDRLMVLHAKPYLVKTHLT